MLELAERLLRDFGGLQGLHRASLDELSQARGIGQTKAVKIKAAIELGRRPAGYQSAGSFHHRAEGEGFAQAAQTWFRRLNCNVKPAGG